MERPSSLSEYETADVFFVEGAQAELFTEEPLPPRENISPEQSPGIAESVEIQKTPLALVSQLAGRLKHFSKNWEKIASNNIILSWIRGYTIPLIKQIPQPLPPKEPTWSAKEELAIFTQISQLLENAIQIVESITGQFIARMGCLRVR